MPLLNTAQFTLSGMTTKRSLGDRLQDHYITVTDFGAVGDGDNDDTDAIQAALDFAYGTKEAPHGSPDLSNDVYTFHTGDLVYTNKPVFFPAGNYKITSMLRVNVGYGVNLIGAGSHQTRLFWSGTEEGPPAEQVYDADPDPDEFGSRVNFDPQPDTVSSLITFYMCWGSSMEGITFDASDTQDCAFRLYHWPPHITNQGQDPTDLTPPYEFVRGDDGSHGVYRDCHFTNAAVAGFQSAGAAMGSERVFTSCRFTNCGEAGHVIYGANALNHSFYGCHFENNEVGHMANTAGHVTMFGCTFANNSVFDICQQYGGNRIVNCSSTSVNFALTNGLLIGNRHVNGSPGTFYCLVHPAMTLFGSDNGKATLIGNYSSNGVLGDDQHAIFLKANTFDNPDYLDLPMAESVCRIWEDGVMVKVPS